MSYCGTRCLIYGLLTKGDIVHTNTGSDKNTVVAAHSTIVKKLLKTKKVSWKLEVHNISIMYVYNVIAISTRTIYASQNSAWTAMNGVPCAMYSRSACQYIWPIRWSPAALDNKLKIFRTLLGFSINYSLSEKENRERIELWGSSVISRFASSRLSSTVEISSDHICPGSNSSLWAIGYIKELGSLFMKTVFSQSKRVWKKTKWSL